MNRTRAGGIDRVRLALLIPTVGLTLVACGGSGDGSGDPDPLLSDPTGTSGDTGNLSGGTPDPSTDATTTPSGSDPDSDVPPELLTRLQAILDAATIQPLEPVVPVARSMRALYRSGTGNEQFALSGSRTGTNILFDNDTGAPYLLFDCVDGGTLEANIGSMDSFVDAGKYEFDACRVGPVTLNGKINEYPAFIDEAAGETGSFSLQGFSYSDARDDTVRETTGAPGAVQLTTAADEPMGLRSARVHHDSITIRMTSPDGSFQATELATDVSLATQTGGRLQLTTEFLIRFAPDEAYASVKTIEPFERSGDEPAFTSGSLRATGVDYVMTLDADGGDPATFTLALEQAGSRTAWSVAWSGVEGFEPFDPDSVDPGL